MMQPTLSMLLGAALVALGVLASALADRIRGLRPVPQARETSPLTSRARPLRASVPVVETSDLIQPAAPRPLQGRLRAEPKPPTSLPRDERGEDVIAALVAAGYKKPIATEAAWACSTTDRTTVERWTAAALRRCARGGLS